MDEFDFTLDEIREQLELFGYQNVDDHKLVQFKTDLEQLVRQEKSHSNSWATDTDASLWTDEPSSPTSHNAVRLPGRPLQTNNEYLTSNTERVSYGSSDISTGPLSDVSSQHQSYFPEAQRGVAVPFRSEAKKSGAIPKTKGPIPQAGFIKRMPTEQLEEETADYSDISTVVTSDRKMMKRKVRRKIDGHSIISDETTATESDFDLSSLPEQSPTDIHHGRSEPIQKLTQASFSQRPKTAPTKGTSAVRIGSPTSAGKSRNITRSDSLFHFPESSKSLILPMSVQPNERNLKRDDPVKRYESYKEFWRNHKFPAEDQHKALRWDVRAQMVSYEPVVEKKHRRFIPNTYEAPSDKKRKDVIWETRQNMAKGVVRPAPPMYF